MLVYIVWKTDYDNKVYNHILGIYTDKESAIKQYKKATEKIKNNNENMILTNRTLLDGFNTINNKIYNILY